MFTSIQSYQSHHLINLLAPPATTLSGFIHDRAKVPNVNVHEARVYPDGLSSEANRRYVVGDEVTRACGCFGFVQFPRPSSALPTPPMRRREELDEMWGLSADGM